MRGAFPAGHVSASTLSGGLTVSQRVPSHGLEKQGFANGAAIHWNLTAAPLIELAVKRGEGLLSKEGPLVVETGKHTGRSANDKFTVCDAETESTIWWGKSNKPMTPEHFATLKEDFLAQLATKETLFAQDLFGGSQPEYRVKVRVVTEYARSEERRVGKGWVRPGRSRGVAYH